MTAVDAAAVKRAWPLADLLARRYGADLRPDGGRRLRARCPLPGHERDRDPSFVVYAEQQSFYCYGCGRGGDVIALVRAMEGLDFRAAVARLADGRPPPAHAPVRPPPRAAIDDAPATRAALAEAVDFYSRRLAIDAPALAYLRARGIGPATVARRQLGLAGGLVDHLACAGRPRRPFFQAGLLRPDGRERLAGRIVIPNLVDGRPTWLTGRLLSGAAREPPVAPRYESLPGPRPLLGLSGLPPGCDRVVVVEGPFDALLLDEWGYPAVALGGAHATPTQLARLAGFRRVLLALDRDPAGARAAAELATALGERAAVASLPDGVKDVGDLADRPDGRRRLRAAWGALVPAP